jgi:hypothetical protein
MEFFVSCFSQRKNLTATLHFALTPTDVRQVLSSRHLLAAERFSGSIARNGRITHPW